MKRPPSRFLQPSLFAADPTLPALDDAAARRTAREATGRSLLLQASAGTGKTTTLIERILQLLLVDGVRLSKLAAMTFTEKAAAEMRTRLREKLEDDPSPRATAARNELDRAEIGTIHAFAASLLRERPVEAGADPSFVTPDDTTQAVLFDDTWEGWVLREAHEEASPLVKALRAGAAIEEIRMLARELFSERFLVASAALPTDSLTEVRRELTELVRLFEAILFQTPSEFHGLESVRAIERLRNETRGLLYLDEAALAAWAPLGDFERRQRNVWSDETIDLVDDAKVRFRALRRRFRVLALEPLLVSLIGCLRSGFLAEVDARKRASSFVDFDDLLLRARDLIRHHPAVREHFRNRFDTLIVDEFQDTDPVQAEIILRLAAPEPQTDACWIDLVPAPGRLFVVGDPKQSIYRFRRADVESYRSIALRFDERDRLTLTANFRSTPAILDLVNALFERIMGGPRKAWESPYSPLAPSRADAERGAPPVLLLPPPPSHGDEIPMDELKRREAWAVANLLRLRFDRRWKEIAVLVPRNAGVELFQEVFTEAGIPAVLEGGTSYFRREETAAVVSALHAIDDPTAGVEVVAALKSFLFGFSDVELLDAAEAGARFDDPSSMPPGSPIADAVALLSRLRASRHLRPLSETLSDLLESRFAHLSIQEGAVVNPLQGLANLDRFLLVARDLDSQGLSFTRAVRHLTKRLLDTQAEPRAYEEAGDAVRLMTLHKAKGLQFDIVVVAGLGLAEGVQRSGRDSFRCDRPDGEWGVKLKIGDVTVATPGHGRIAEADSVRERAENERELYVALTRPKRQLVLSLFRKVEVKKDGSVKDELSSSILGDLSWTLPGGALDPALVEYVAGDPTESRAPLPTASATDPEPLDLAAERAAVEERLAALRGSRSRLLRRAGEHEHAANVEDAPREQRDSAPGDRALRVGIAVHDTMERLLAPGAPSTLAAALAAVDPEIADEVRKLVTALEASDVTKRARRAARRFVELPLLYAAADGALVEGKIDLLFEEPDGYVLVDWKTDRIDSPADRARREASYAPQLAAYVEGLRAVLGSGARIKEKRLVFARG